MKNKFKAFLMCLLAVGMIGATAACATGENPNPDNGSVTPVTKYTVKFVDYDDSVISEAEYEEGATIVVPADPTRAEGNGYTYVFAGWDSEVAETATANVTYKATYTQTAVEYTVTFKNGDAEVSTETYTVEDKEITVPEVPAKEHYNGAWEAYELNGGNVVVNAVYTPIEYTVTFKVDGVDYKTENYTVEAAEITAPSVPNKAGFEGAWETYVLEGGNVVVNAVYTAIEYNVVFKADGVEVATEKYTVADKEITVPTVPEKEGHDGAWESYELTMGDVEVNAVYTLKEYSITFMNGDKVVEEVKFNVENGDEKVAPAVPVKEGYSGGEWEAYDFTKLENQTVSVKADSYTANTYTITYNANGGSASAETQEVIFDDTYNLATATAPKTYQEFLGWVDEDGNMVKAGDAWRIAKDVTLTASYSAGVIFESLTEVPSYMSNKSGRIASFSIVEINGNKVLEAKTTADSTSDVGVFITTEMLNALFEDPSVEYMAFDLKSGATRTGKTVYYHGEGATKWTQYENGSYDSIPVDSFKTYYFPRAEYNKWVSANVTEARFVMIGGSLVYGGESFYIDNIRGVTAAEKSAGLFSFEYGGVRTNNGNSPLFYETNKGAWDLAFSNIDSTTAGFTSEIVSDGNRAFKFTKLAGDTAFTFNHTADTTMETAMREAGYVSYDLYVPEGSDAKVVKNGFSSPLSVGWNTVYAIVPAANPDDANKNNEWSRFTDTTASTYVIDNIRFITEEEYYENAYGFESGAGVLRTAEIGDSSTNGGVFYYYGGADATASTYSFAFLEGDGAGDVATLSNPRYDSTVTHSGKYSLAFDKGSGYMSVQMRNDSTAYSKLSGGFTFWIYSTTAINGTTADNFINGVNGKFNGGAGITIPANTWTQVTVTAEEIGNGRFLIIQGSVEGTIYLDDFQPLPVEDAE